MYLAAVMNTLAPIDTCLGKGEKFSLPLLYTNIERAIMVGLPWQSGHGIRLRI